jgi:hypothetical protein
MRTGERNSFYGRSHSEETKRILSEQRKGIKQPDELNKKRSETLKKKKVNQGTKNRGAKLTDDQVIEIRKRLASGERNMDLALEYGLSKSSIGNIKSGASWKHLPGVM